ncbi:MAG: BolA family protein [bacterium]
MKLQVEKLEEALTAALCPVFLEVLDDSAKHRGHAGARQGGGGHYLVTVVAPAFEGKTLVEQHRMVNEALKGLFGSEIHALALNTYSPSQWQRRGGGGASA